MSRSMAGQVVLITGASSGIGRALARLLAAQGARLALAGRSVERLEAVRASLGDVEAITLPGDLSRADDVERMVDRTAAHYGRIDVLLANAGIYIAGDVVDGDPAAFSKLIAVNVDSVIHGVRAVLPGMIARKTGDIIVTSSISGHQALHWEPVYSASKHAVQAFVHGMRRQGAPHNVRVGAIAPGIVLNELWGYSDPAAIEAKVAAREGLRSEDVAEAILFMLTRPANVTIRDLVILPQNQDI